MNTPKYIFDILQDELRLQQVSLLKKIATKYNIPEDELIELLPKQPKIIPKTAISITVEKKIEPKKTPPTNCRCCARIWGRGKGGQCTRKCFIDDNDNQTEYCLQHQNNRKHGRIDEDFPKEVFPRKETSLYK